MSQAQRSLANATKLSESNVCMPCNRPEHCVPMARPLFAGEVRQANRLELPERPVQTSIAALSTLDTCKLNLVFRRSVLKILIRRGRSELGAGSRCTRERSAVTRHDGSLAQAPTSAGEWAPVEFGGNLRARPSLDRCPVTFVGAHHYNAICSIICTL